MPSVDQAIKSIADNLRNMGRDVADLKSRVGRLTAQDGGGHYMPFSNYASLSSDIVASSGIFLATIPKQITVLSWKQTWHVQTSDVSNYWQIGFSSLSGLHYVIDTVPSTGAAGVWNRYDYINLNLVLPESYRYVYIGVNKIGAPGPLYLGTPMVYFV